MRTVAALFYALFIITTCNPTAMNPITCHFEKADLLITDPIYFINDSDIWEENCEELANNRSLDRIGLTTGIIHGCGDVYRDQIVDEDGTVLGCFCSDSYTIACVRLDEAMAINPELADDIENSPNCYTIIKDFTGDVEFISKKEKYYDEQLVMITIIGRGTTNFHSDFEEPLE